MIATTGFTEEELGLIREAEQKIPVFRSANMSLGVNLICELAKTAAKLLPDFDIEIIEKHEIYNDNAQTEISSELNISDSWAIINKPSFGYTDWERELQSLYIGQNNEGVYLDEPDYIEIIGLCTDICVVSNALIIKAIFPETEIVVDASCCAGVTPETHQAALTTMKMCQIKVIGE